MRALIERAERAARDAQARRIGELAARFAGLLPEARIEMRPDGVSVSGPRLLERWLDDSELRFATRIGR